MIRQNNLDELVALGRMCDGMERSWSIAEAGPVEERFLLFFDGIDDRVNAISRCASALGAPRSMIQAWQDRFSLADAVGIAVNTNGSSVRLYVQYWDHLAQRVQKGNFSPFQLYWGVKYLPDSSLREDVYMCLPQVGEDVFWPPIKKALAGLGIDPARAEKALPNLTDETCIFTLINDGLRQSWLATVRRADPNRAVVSSALGEHFGVAPEAWQRAMMAQSNEGGLLHVAGGQDPIKGQFTTLYFEAAVHHMQAAFTTLIQNEG